MYHVCAHPAISMHLNVSLSYFDKDWMNRRPHTCLLSQNVVSRNFKENNNKMSPSVIYRQHNYDRTRRCESMSYKSHMNQKQDKVLYVTWRSYGGFIIANEYTGVTMVCFILWYGEVNLFRWYIHVLFWNMINVWQGCPSSVFYELNNYSNHIYE